MLESLNITGSYNEGSGNMPNQCSNVNIIMNVGNAGTGQDTPKYLFCKQ